MMAEASGSWLLRALIGPSLWAVGFAGAYGLHGAGCALGWDGIAVGPATLLKLGLYGVWGVTLVACLVVLVRMPRGEGLSHRLPRVAAWIGLGSTAFSLAPMAITPTC